MFTHTITGAKVARYLPSHHRDTPTNRVHAVNDSGLVVRHGASVATLCGRTVGIFERPETYTPTYNCRPCTDATRVTCRDCLNILGV